MDRDYVSPIMACVDGFHQFFSDSPTSEVLSIVRDSFYSSSGIGSDRGTNQQINSSSSSSYDQLHFDQNFAPPKITPISGVLSKGKVAIRPVAFKPVLPYNRQTNVSGPKASQLSSSTCDSSVDPSRLDSEDVWKRSLDTSASYSSSANLAHHNPSPTDSGVAELEALLREKDSEINFLRETIEHNERVIFRVYQEKENKLKTQYETRAKAMQHKMMLENYQLQQENRKLKEECQLLRRDKEATEKNLESVRNELRLLGIELEETEWKMCEKTGEISLLKSQLKELHAEQTTRTSQLAALKTHVRQHKNEIEKEEESEQVALLQREITELQRALDSCRSAMESEHQMFCEERIQWFREKDKVIRYQKQLQVNYVQMFRQIQHLNGELKVVDESHF